MFSISPRYESILDRIIGVASRWADITERVIAVAATVVTVVRFFLFGR